MRNRKATILCTAGFLIWLATAALPQDPIDFELTRSVDLVQNAGGYYRIESNLGELPLNSRGKVKLVVSNAVGQDVQVGSYYSGCACITASVSQQKVAANGVFEINLLMETQQSTKNSSQMAAFSIARSKDGTDDISIRLAYRIPGLVAFVDTMGVVEVSNEAKSKNFTIPLIVEAPARADDLAFKATGAFAKLKHHLRTSAEGNCYLDCSIDIGTIPEAGFAGEILLEDRRTGIKDSTLVILKKRSKVTIAPAPITFRRNGDTYTASAIVRVDLEKQLSVAESESPIVQPEKIDCTGTVAGGIVAVKVNDLSAGVARLHLVITPENSIEDLENYGNSNMFLIFKLKGANFVEKCAVDFLNKR